MVVVEGKEPAEAVKEASQFDGTGRKYPRPGTDRPQIIPGHRQKPRLTGLPGCKRKPRFHITPGQVGVGQLNNEADKSFRFIAGSHSSSLLAALHSIGLPTCHRKLHLSAVSTCLICLFPSLFPESTH